MIHFEVWNTTVQEGELVTIVQVSVPNRIHKDAKDSSLLISELVCELLDAFKSRDCLRLREVYAYLYIV